MTQEGRNVLKFGAKMTSKWDRNVLYYFIYIIYEQKRHLSAYSSDSWYIQTSKPLVSFDSLAGRFESYHIALPKDRVSRNKAQIDSFNLQRQSSPPGMG